MLAGQPNRVHAPHARDTHLRGGHDQNGALGVGECVCVTCSAAAAAAAGWLVQQEPATHPAAIWPVWHAVPQRLRCCQGCTVYAHSLRTTQEGAKHPLDGFLALPAACCRNVCVCVNHAGTPVGPSTQQVETHGAHGGLLLHAAAADRCVPGVRRLLPHQQAQVHTAKLCGAAPHPQHRTGEERGGMLLGRRGARKGACAYVCVSRVVCKRQVMRMPKAAACLAAQEACPC